ncbi:MAG: hypothetical protein IPH08_12115 [Rhodocyclaceae bacterium]|nr:hypothetical protein [Rhodocyclaceae bacterium]MBK6907767.1 hypothetical protein [Rhodocyclaceae bacterium]
MKTAAIVVLAILAALAFPFLLPTTPSAPASESAELLPWHITRTETGATRVFGLTLGQSTLSDAQVKFFIPPEIAIVGLRNEAGSLEAFFDGVRLNALTGKLVMTVRVPDEVLKAMRQRATKTDHMDSAMLRSTLSADDLTQAKQMPIRAIVFVPAARLDEPIVHDRFGPPAERITTEGDVQHLLYPALGLDIAINAKGRAQLQYVAPDDFEMLRAPLKQQAAGSSQ